MTRSEARELLMQLLFQMEVQNDYSDKLKNHFLDDPKEPKLLKEQKSYFDTILTQITQNLQQIDTTLEDASVNWKTSRMSKVDLAILRLAVAELLFAEDIPDSVAINEAVDMAKKYGTDESGKFINGLLGKVAKEKHEQ